MRGGLQTPHSHYPSHYKWNINEMTRAVSSEEWGVGIAYVYCTKHCWCHCSCNFCCRCGADESVRCGESGGRRTQQVISMLWEP